MPGVPCAGGSAGGIYRYASKSDIGEILYMDGSHHDAHRMWDFIKRYRPDILKVIEEEHLQSAIADMVEGK